MTPEAEALSGQLYEQAQRYTRQEAGVRRDMKDLEARADDYRERRAVLQRLVGNPIALEEIIAAMRVITRPQDDSQPS